MLEVQRFIKLNKKLVPDLMRLAEDLGRLFGKKYGVMIINRPEDDFAECEFRFEAADDDQRKRMTNAFADLLQGLKA